MTQDPNGRHPRRCTATNRRGEQCGRAPAKGALVCRLHGGAAPQVKAAAERRVAHAAAMEAVQAFGLPEVVDPNAALLAEVHRTAGHVAWLADLVANIEHDLDADDPRSGLLQYRRKDGILWQAPSVWVELYQTERRHLVAVCAAALKAGVEEREVQIAQEQGRLVAELIHRVIAAVPAEHQDVARRAAAEQLRLLPGGELAPGGTAT